MPLIASPIRTPHRSRKNIREPIRWLESAQNARSCLKAELQLDDLLYWTVKPFMQSTEIDCNLYSRLYAVTY